MTNSNVSHPTPVLRGHPLLVAPVIVVAIWVRAVEDVAAAQLAFVVATGGVLVIEVTARLPVRAAWSRRLWPPSENEPAGLAPLLAGGAWTAAAAWVAGRLGEVDAAAMEAGVRGCQVAIAIQLGASLTSAVRRPVRLVDDETLTTGSAAGAR